MLLSSRAVNVHPKSFATQKLEQGRNLITDDIKQAISCFQTSAEHGNPEAQYRLACYLEDGYGIPKNEKLAFSWLKKSAEQGFAQAQTRLGRLFKYGIGTDINFDNPYFVYEKPLPKVLYLQKIL